MFSKKKKKIAGKLEIGLDLKRCAECDKYSRLCLVDDQPATFHRWVEEVKTLLRINCFVSLQEMAEIRRRFDETGVVQNGCDTETVRVLFALIEYPDGTVEKVKPERVRFQDRGEISSGK